MRHGPFASPSDRVRFEREVRILAQLNHPNIVTVHDSGVTPGGDSYFVMNYIAGLTLDGYVERMSSRGVGPALSPVDVTKTQARAGQEALRIGRGPGRPATRAPTLPG